MSNLLLLCSTFQDATYYSSLGYKTEQIPPSTTLAEKKAYKLKFEGYNARYTKICVVGSNSALCRPIAQKHGFIYLDTRLSTDVEMLLKLQGRRAQSTNDNSTIDIPFSYHIDFKQYLSEDEPTNLIKKLLAHETKLAIQSPAGSGKSTVLQQLFNGKDSEKTYLKAVLGLDRCIILVPTVSIAKQLHKSLAKDHLKHRISVIIGTTTANEKSEALHDKVIICTYDQVENLKKLYDGIFKESLLVVDESHQLVTALNYRGKAMYNTFTVAMAEAQRVLLLSATPNEFFSSFLADVPQFQFPLLICNQLHTNRIDLTIRLHSKSNAKTDIFNWIFDRKKAGFLGILYNDNSKLKVARQKAKEEHGYNLEHLTSAYDETSVNNHIYKSIVENSDFGSYVCDGLLTTSLLELGVSIKEKVSSINLISSSDYAEIIQFSTRARYYDDEIKKVFGVNKVVDVNVFWAKSKALEYKGNAADKFTDFLHRAEMAKNSNDANTDHDESEYKHIAGDVKTHCITINKERKIHILNILHDLHEEQKRYTTPETLCERISRWDSRFNCKIEEIDLSTDVAFKDDLKRNAADKELQRHEFFKMLAGDNCNIALSCVRKESKDIALKKEMLSQSQFIKVDNEYCTEFLAENETVFKGYNKANEAVVRSVLALMRVGVNLPDAIGIVRTCPNLDEQIQFRQIADRKKRSKDSKLTVEERSELSLDIELNRYFSEAKKTIKKGERREYWTKPELLTVYKNAYLKIADRNLVHPNTEQIMCRLNAMFEFECSRKVIGESKVFIYTLMGKRKEYKP